MGSVNLDNTGSGSAITLSSDGTSLLLDGTAVGGGGGPTFKTFGTDSIMVGDDATGTINNANYNTGLGVNIFAALTTGDNNTANGYSALEDNTTGSSNTGLGYNALRNNTTASNNTAVGAYAGDKITTAASNVFMGTFSGYSTTTGSNNISIGVNAFWGNTTGSDNVAIGHQALTTLTTQSKNTAVGYRALRLNTTHSNTAFGYESGKSTTTGWQNTAYGTSSLSGNTTGYYNTAVGSDSLFSNTTAANNTAVGYQALRSNTTGTINTAVGKDALTNNTTGADNTAVGYALVNNTTGSSNVAVGREALLNNTASKNTAVGSYALYANTTGSNNTAYGYSALYANTTASENSAFGYRALKSNTTGLYNTAVGYLASEISTTSIQNVIVGNEAGKQISSGSYNSIVGAHAGSTLTTGQRNAFLGRGSGNAVTTGSKNTIIGSYTGNQGGLDIRTASNNIVLSDGDGNPRQIIDSSGRVLVGKTASGMTANGVELRTGVTDDYAFTATSLNQPVLLLNRHTDNGMIIRMRKANSDVGAIGNSSSGFYIGGLTGSDFGVVFDGGGLLPSNGSGTLRDNSDNLGHASYRWEDAFITNGATTGSDANDKQDIATLTATEMLVAARLSQTFRTYRWKDSVAEKGDNARTHTGTIAQEVQAAFTAEGLDASDYAMFMSDTWWEHDVDVPAVEADEDNEIEAVDAYTRTDTYDTEAEAPEGATSKTRLGIRYPELLSFVASYNEQRFASIEARLTTLEG